ncbi:MAG: DUF3971 domain-containing protein [Allorhizobium sp.]
MVVVVGGVIVALESGTLDRTLSGGATSALNSALGPNFRADIGSTAIRFSKGLQLTVVARDVTVFDNASSLAITETDAVRMVLDPIALFSGQVTISEIEADDIRIDTALLPSGPGFDVSKFRIDSVPLLLETAFVGLDGLQAFIARGNLDSVRIGGIEINTPDIGGKPVALSLDDMVMRRSADSSLGLTGQMSINGQVSPIDIKVQSEDGHARSLSASLVSANLSDFLLLRDDAGKPLQGLEANADLSIEAQRSGDGIKPRLSMALTSKDGAVYFESNRQEVNVAAIKVAYDFDKRTIEFLSSQAQFGPMIIPFTGGLIDLDRLENSAQYGAGIGIDLLVSQGLASIPATGEQPFPFGLKVFGRFVHAKRELQVERMTVTTDQGTMTGSVRVRLDDEGPEISVAAEVVDMQTGVLKQLWPYWMADKPRAWVQQNLFGGTIRQGSIAVFIPSGRISAVPKPLHLDENELHVSLDLDNARVNVAGDIPPLRDTAAHIEMKGKRLDVQIKSGMSYFATGRTVKVENAHFVIAEAYEKPLIGDLDITVSGSADAVAELAGLRPIEALQRSGFQASDFKGEVKATAKVRMGLIRDQNPPAPDWTAQVQLSGVDVAKEFDGRKITALDGTLDIDNESARLEGKGRIDDVPMEVSLTEPIAGDSKAQRSRVVKISLGNADRDRFMPGLDDVIDGSVDVVLSRVDEDHQAVTVDLSRAVVTVPGTGWTKGRGIASKANFSISEQGDQTLVDAFEFSGDGFGASGRLMVGKSGLESAVFSRVRLSPDDDYAVSVKRAQGSYQVNVSGKSADVRPIVARLKSETGQTGRKSGASTPVRVEGRLDRMVGFNDEALSNVTLLYSAGKSRISALDLSGVTSSGQAVVAQLDDKGGRDEISVTTSDAGTLTRMLNVYDKMRDGLLNLKLIGSQGNTWSGSLDIRNFRLDNEARLQSIVSTPASSDGRSLNSAVKRDIDVSSAKFQRAFARIVYTDGAIQLDNGIVRGEQIGATFQGTLRDKAGNMEMTGTFMPAYGLNRLFAELPVIGILLGNGRDRGLLGITFKLTGSADAPQLAINPLSIIAPGVFRQIFEFQ